MRQHIHLHPMRLPKAFLRTAAHLDTTIDTSFPSTSGLWEAFAGRGLDVRGLVVSALVTAGTYTLILVLDIGSYIFRSHDSANGWYAFAGIVFVVGTAMSLAASSASLADCPATAGIAELPIRRRQAVLLFAAGVAIIGNISYRFLPFQPTPRLRLIVLDLALFGLFMVIGWKKNRCARQ